VTIRLFSPPRRSCSSCSRCSSTRRSDKRLTHLSTETSAALWGVIAEFDQGLATFEHGKNRRLCRLYKAPQVRVQGVAAGDPDHLRRGGMVLEQVDEVAILGHDHNLRVAGSVEDLTI
jgi:hypothetical protein